MCIFHKWDKWEPYTESGIIYNKYLPADPGRPYTERRQKRTCKRCGKEQDKKVQGS